MSDQYPSILFFGPPGSGKGTQAKFLSELTGHYHLSAGDIFRNLPKDSKPGKLQREYSQKGLLIPDTAAADIWKSHTAELVKNSIYKPSCQLLLTDGMPRTAKQVQLLKNSLLVRAVISLEVSDEGCLIRRLSARAAVQGRVDDRDLQTLKTRLQVYESQTKEVLQSFPREIIIPIRAEQRPFEVMRDILDQTSELLKYPD